MKLKGKQSLNDFIKFNYSELKQFEIGNYVKVETAQDLKKTIQEIQQFAKIGVDTEQSFQDTYEAFLCLIQISTEDKDYLIDVIAIHDKQLIKSEIEKIFLDKNIIKVFYAGQSDILWLQRDYNITLSNYFDVQTAATFLKKEQDSSLTYLISKYCNYNFEKTKKKQLQLVKIILIIVEHFDLADIQLIDSFYQLKIKLSEWSIRPLTEEQLNYAALDSHFLIKLRYELLLEMIKELDFSRTLECLNKMQKQTKKKYQKKQLDEQEYFQIFKKQSQNDIQKQGSDLKNSKEWISLVIMFIELANIREQYCIDNNKHIQTVLSDESLYQFAHSSFDFQSSYFKSISSSSSLLSMSNQFKEVNSDQFLESQSNKIYDILNSFETNAEQHLLKFNNLVDSIQQQQTNSTQNKNIKNKAIQKKDKFEETYAMKVNPYEKNQILSPDGKLLSVCNDKKIKWYLSKNLATLLSTNPTVIQLHFQPSGKVLSEQDQKVVFANNYQSLSSLTSRKNMCTVCGSTQQFAKFYVIPTLYRRHFPENLKIERIQDIIVVCLDCHRKADIESDKLINEICKKYKVEKMKLEEGAIERDVIFKLSKYVTSYGQNKINMPKQNRIKLKAIIREHYAQFLELKHVQIKFKIQPNMYFGVNKQGQVKINDLFCDYCLSLQEYKKTYKENTNNDCKNQHGKLVVEQLKSHKELQDFIQMWRDNFVKTMKPKFLPSDWDENLVQQNQNEEILNNQQEI